GPARERPFAVRKPTLLLARAARGGGGAVSGPPVARAPVPARALALAWVVAAATGALLGEAPEPWALALDAAGGVWMLALLHLGVDGDRAARAISAAGAGVAAVAVLQGAGLDPFRWLGWPGDPPRPRLTGCRHPGHPAF